MIRSNRFFASAAFAAAFSMAASPVLAADMPAVQPQAQGTLAKIAQWSDDATSAERHRRWRHRDRVDAGDILTGILIIGGIAAIADAASKDNDRRQRPREDYRYRENRDQYRPRSGDSGQGIDRAVDMCLAEIERDVRVDQVDNVSRDGEGWVVSGRIYNGDGFYCRIDNNGRISDVNFSGGQAAASDVEDNQWSDEDYAEARRRTERPTYGEEDDARPAYPGGPVDGDLEAEDGYGG
jgi:hypothetical protein